MLSKALASSWGFGIGVPYPYTPWVPGFPSFPIAVAVLLVVVVSPAAVAAVVYLVSGVHTVGCPGIGSYSSGSRASWPQVHAGPGMHSCLPSCFQLYPGILHMVPGKLGWADSEEPSDHKHEPGHTHLDPCHTHHLPAAVPGLHTYPAAAAVVASWGCKHAAPSFVALVECTAAESIVVVAAVAACNPEGWTADGGIAGTSD